MYTRPAGLLAVTLAGVTIASATLVAAPLPADAAASRPNILIILTDDQRAGGSGTLSRAESTLAVMDRTLYWFGERGTRFINAHATTPVCCPSRASIMTGRYAHNHGVNSNPEHGDLDLSTTIQHRLHEAGYRTGIFGKFLNQWDLNRDPLDFDAWTIFNEGYLNRTYNVNGTLRTVSTYSTRYLSNQASAFIRGTEGNDAAPWFAVVAPYAPHEPATPETLYEDAPVPAFYPSPAMNESDRSDKPAHVRAVTTSLEAVRSLRRRQLRTLMSVDDMVDRLMRQLVAQGERTRTLAFFLSDNGYLWGEHGLTGKYHPYLPSTEVHLFMRWPEHVRMNVWDSRLVANIDLVPTILEAAGLEPDPAVPLDGRSLFSTAARDRILLEQWTCRCMGPTAPPDWASLRTRDYQYTEYYSATGDVTFREYYDLVDDSHQLRNLLADGDLGNDPDTGSISAQLQLDRVCAGSACP